MKDGTLFRLLNVGDVLRAQAAVNKLFVEVSKKGRVTDPPEVVGVVIDSLAESIYQREVLEKLWPEQKPNAT